MKTNLFSQAALGFLGGIALAASAPAQSTYDRWIDAFPGLSVWEKAPGADPDFDDLANIAEQLLGLNPTVPLGSDPRRGNAPALFQQGRTWEFRYTVDAAAQSTGEIVHGIQRTRDLADWLPVTPQINGNVFSTPVDFGLTRQFYRTSFHHEPRGGVVPAPTFGARSEESLGVFNPDPAGPWALSQASDGDWRANFGQHWTNLRGGMWKKMASKFLIEGDNIPVAVLFSAESYLAEAGRRLVLRVLVDGQPMRPGDVIFSDGGSPVARAARSFEFTGDFDRGLHVVEVQWLADPGASCFIRDAALLVRQGDRADESGALRPVTPDSGPNLGTTLPDWVDVPGLDRQITTTSGECITATVSAEAYASSAHSVWMRVLVDGVEAEPGPVEFASGQFEGTRTMAWGAAVSAGSHDVQVQWHADSGGTAGLGDRTLTVASGAAGTGVPLPHKYFVSAKNAVSAPAAFAPVPNLSQAVVFAPDSDVSVIFTAEFPDAPGGEVRARLSLGGAPVAGSEMMLTAGETRAGVHCFTFDAKHIAAGGPGLFTTVRVEWMTTATAASTIRARSMILLVKPHLAPDLAESPAIGLSYNDVSGPANFRVEPMRGKRHVLVILFDPARPGHPAPSIAALTQAFFGASDSLADYFSEISGGQLVLQNAGVLGPYAADHPWQYYWNGPGDHQDKWVEAITKADDDFNFSDYDFDGDGYISAWNELAIFVIVPQTNSAGFVRNLWTGEVAQPRDGVYLDLITEWYVNDPLRDYYLGAHELGHQMLVLADLYAKSTSTADVGTRPGVYCLMDGGGYAVAPHLNPAYKLALGWVTPRFVTATSQHSLEDVKTSREVIALPRAPGGPTDEYVLVENRPSPPTNARYDFGLPDAGLAVWHIVESTSDSTIPPGCMSAVVWDIQTGGEASRGGIRLVRPGILFSDPTSLWSSEHYDLDGFGLVCPSDGPARNILRWAAGDVSFELRNFPAASSDMTFDIIKP